MPTSPADPADELPARFRTAWSTERPIWQQLAERLGEWIATCPVGYRIPDERSLATMAAVNRLTLRKATARLLREGALERKARTTRVRGRARQESAPAEFRPHPLMGGAPARPRSLVIACFESLPWQAACWREAQPLIAAAAGCPVEFRAVPVTVAAAPDYAAFLAREQVDIAFLTSLMFSGLDEAGALATHPLQGLLDQPGLAPAVQTMPERAGKRFVPMHLGWRCVLVAESALAGMPTAARRDVAAFATWLAGRRGHLPPAGALVDDPAFLFLVAGEPRNEPNDAYFRALGAIGAALAPALPACTWRFDEPARGRAFAAGQALAFVGHGYYGPGRFAATDGLRWRALPLGPLKGCAWRQAASGVAMTSWCHAPGPAAAAMAAFLSPAVQELVGRHRLNLPVRESAWNAYARGLGLAGAKDIAPAAASLRMSFEQDPWSRYLETTASALLRGYIGAESSGAGDSGSGKASPRAITEALRRAAAPVAASHAHPAAV